MTDTHPLTLEQAARRLGVATRTMQRYVDAYDKHGDRSKGFDAVKVATQRGRGYEWRFRFGTDAPVTTPPDATTDVALDASSDAPDASVAHALVDATGSSTEALRMVLVALAEARQESADLAYRLGASETERRQLEAEREELRRRAEAAEAELSATRLAHERERDELRAQAVPESPSEAPTDTASVDTPAPEEPAQGFWARLRRVFSGGE